MSYKIEKIKAFQIQSYYFKKLKLGNDLMKVERNIIKNEVPTVDPYLVKTYSFCSDTSYNESIVPLIKFVDLLYHEATFLDSHINLAKKTKHSTAKQAAKIANSANVKKLLLGHYSNRYSDKKDFIKEASTGFESILLSEDLETFAI